MEVDRIIIEITSRSCIGYLAIDLSQFGREKHEKVELKMDEFGPKLRLGRLINSRSRHSVWPCLTLFVSPSSAASRISAQSG